ncbi:type II secretion system minor pseudopilin GspJ [Zooshikella sp. RANM57]|uniref:type II secretion system minor pseudopilin GspJ n=1 Tax=Zooshikella sp. RANM57 TaxID=3425863 RepID=UPI003D6DD51F
MTSLVTAKIKNMTRSDGFTLLELMIAIAIFSIVSMAAYSLFHTTARTQAVTEKSLKRLNEVQRAFLIMEKDFSQLAPRPIKSELGEALPAFVANQGGYLVEFTRQGWRNPALAKRSEFQRVAYTLEDDKLIRRFWLVLDRAPNAPYKEQIILTGVNGISFRFLNQEHNWVEDWAVANNNSGASNPLLNNNADPKELVPGGVELSLDDPRYGRMVRYFVGVNTPKPQQSNNQIPGATGRGGF